MKQSVVIYSRNWAPGPGSKIPYLVPNPGNNYPFSAAIVQNTTNFDP